MWEIKRAGVGWMLERGGGGLKGEWVHDSYKIRCEKVQVFGHIWIRDV